MKTFTAKEILDNLDRHKGLLIKYRVRKIGLFGSFSRNESTDISDIDLLVDFEEKSYDNYYGLAEELETVFGRKVDLLTEKGISPHIYLYIKNEVLWYEA
ncbi:MAG: nucleotidyltransferase [Flavobacterium sp.]|nr:nucleotidyltransferase [Flavobacterium sp.]